MANEVEIRITADGKGVKAEIAKIKAEAKDLEKAFDGAGKKVGDFGKAFASFESMGASAHPKIAGIAAAIPAIGAAAGAAIPLLLGLGAAGGTVALGMDGIKKAAEQAKKPFEDLKKSVSGTFQKELTQPFKDLGQTIPKLTKDFQGVATSVSGLVKELVGVATSEQGVQQLQQTLQGASNLIKGMTPGIKDFVSALLEVGADVAPNMERLGQAIGKIGSELGAVLAFEASEGNLGKAMDNFSVTLEGVADVANALLGTLIEMGAALGPGLGQMLTALGDNFEPVTTGLVEIAGAFGELFTALTPLMPVLAELAGAVFHQLAEGIKAATPAIKEFAQWCADNSETLKAWVPIVMSAVVAWKAFSLALKAFAAGQAIVSGLSAVATAVGLIGKNAKDSEKEVGLLRKALEALKVPAGALGTAGTAASGMVQGAGMTAGGALARGAAGLAGSAGVGAAGAGAGVLGGVVAGGALGAYGVAKATGNDKASGNMEAAARGDFSFDQLKEQALQGLEATKLAIQQKLTEIKESIKTTIQGWADGIDGSLKVVWEKIKGAFSGEGGGGLDIAGSLQRAWDTAMTTVQGWGETFKTNLQLAWDGVVEWFKTIPQQTLGQAFDVGVIAGTVYNWAKGIWDTFTRALEENWPVVEEWFRTLPTRIQETVTGWVDTLTQAATDMWEQFKTTSSLKWDEFKAWLDTLPETIQTTVQGWVDTMTKAATDMWDTFKTTALAKWEEFKAWLDTLPQLIADTVQGWIDALVKIATDMWESFKTTAQAKWDEFKAWLDTLPGIISSTVQGWIDALVKIATDSWEQFKITCQKKWDEVKAWLDTLPQLIVDTFKDLPKLLSDAGGAAIDGLVEGMKAKADAAIQYAKDLANQIVGGFNSTQGMNTNSPSKTMRDKAGKWIPLGVIAGMRRTQGRAVREAQLMARKIAAAGVVAGFQPGDPRTIRSGTGPQGRNSRDRFRGWGDHRRGRGRGGRGRHDWNRGWGRHQWSGGNRFPRDASVVAGFQMDDLRAQAAAQRGHGGGRHVTFGGNTDSAFATSFMKLCRTGQIQIR